MVKRRLLLLIALLGALSLVAAACGGDDGNGTATGDEEQIECDWVIGTMGALSGDNASLGVPIRDGVEYAVDQANEAGEVPCDLSLEEEDSQGDPAQAPPLAQSLVENEELVAVAGPYFSGETLAVGEVFSESGVLMTGTGTNETIDEQEFETWFRSVAPDNIQGEVAAAYLKSLGGETTAVIHDNQDYSKGLADSVLENLGDAAEGPFIISFEDDDSIPPVVSEIAQLDPDQIFYGGYTPQAAPLVQQLREAGVEALFLSDDGAKAPEFGEVAGEAAEGAQVTCPCTDPTQQEGATDFVEGMRAEYGENAPGTFAADMFDVTNIIIAALSELNGDEDIEEVRAHVVEYFHNADAIEGVAKTYTWEDNGEFVGGPEDIWVYEWDEAEGNFVSLGPASDLIE